MLYRKSSNQLTVSKKEEIASSRLRISEDVISKMCSPYEENVFTKISKRYFLGCDTELDLLRQLIDGDFYKKYDIEVIRFYYFVHCFYAYQNSEFKSMVSKNVKNFYKFLGARYFSILLASNIVRHLR